MQRFDENRHSNEEAPFPQETMHTIMCDIGIQQLFTQTFGRTPAVIDGVINDPDYDGFKAEFLCENHLADTSSIEMGSSLSQQLEEACIGYINASLPDEIQIPIGTQSNLILDILSKL